MSATPYSSFPADVAEARVGLGAAYRRLGHAIAGHRADLHTIERLTAALGEHADELVGFEPRDRSLERPSGDWGPAPSSGEAMFSFDERPVSGRSAPIGFDLTVTRDDGDAVGHLTFGRAHEGAPGRAHGGMVSALFDDMFGFVLTIEQQPGFTGELTVRYVAGTPIGVALECRVRRTGREGRKLFMSGELTAHDDSSTVFATGTATFIAIDPDDFHRLTT